MPALHGITTLSIFLCLYGFIKEIKVGVPYTFKHQSEVLQLTTEQLTTEVYPYLSYAYLLSCIPVFLFTDLFLYKPTMILEIISQILYRGALTFGSSVWSQQFGQVFFGLASACEIAFFSYIYGILEKEEHERATSWARAATMAGRAVGSCLGQFLILSGIGTYFTLHRIGFIAPCLVFGIVIWLPSVHWKEMVCRLADSIGIRQPNNNPNFIPNTYMSYARYRLRTMRMDVVRIYSSWYMRKWSIWWALTTCMVMQIGIYAQSLWGEVQKDGSSPFNGLAEAGYTATAFLTILAMSFVSINWDKWGETALALISAVDALLIFVFSQTHSIWVMYGCYISYRSLYQVMITIAQWNLARNLVGESYGLVFGLNSFIALFLQTVLTALVSDKKGFGLAPRQQFLVCALCHAFIGMIFASAVAYTLVKRFSASTKVCRRCSSQRLLVESCETETTSAVPRNSSDPCCSRSLK